MLKFPPPFHAGGAVSTDFLSAVVALSSSLGSSCSLSLFFAIKRLEKALLLGRKVAGEGVMKQLRDFSLINEGNMGF